MNRIVLGFVGKARSGKDTVAKMLVKKHFKVFAFADKGKEIMKDLYDLSDEQVFGSLKEVVDVRYGLTPRYMMQYWMTTGCRELDQNVWVRHLENSINSSGWPLVIVTDVRRKNEAEFIKRVGGYLVKVTRAGAAAAGGINNHVSETELDEIGCDFELQNNSSLEELEEAVSKLFLMVIFDICRQG